MIQGIKNILGGTVVIGTLMFGVNLSLGKVKIIESFLTAFLVALTLQVVVSVACFLSKTRLE